jgi:hypothetical protein
MREAKGVSKRTPEQEWSALAHTLDPLARLVNAQAIEPLSPQSQARTNWSLLSALAQYIVNFRNQDPDHPQFTPLLNDALNSNPVPDFTYRIARVRGDLPYRLTGTRGTTRFVEIQQMAGLDGSAAMSGKLLDRISLDDFTIEPDGHFSIALVPQGTSAPEGDHVLLHPDVTTLFVREGAYDWAGELDARLAIACTQPVPVSPLVTPDSAARALSAIPAWMEGRVRHWTAHTKAQIEKQGEGDELRVFRFPGGMVSQVYYEGAYAVGNDDALLIESDVPDTCLYWSFLLTDDHYMTVDWLRHQSSLNGLQARLDSDGKVRTVIALRDPGVPNWLDSGGNRRGLVQIRWNGASSLPVPSMKRVPLMTLRDHLPPDTPLVPPQERAAAIHERRIGAQLRRRW